jgi:hypothetical protein
MTQLDLTQVDFPCQLGRAKLEVVATLLISPADHQEKQCRGEKIYRVETRIRKMVNYKPVLNGINPKILLNTLTGTINNPICLKGLTLYIG